MENILLIDGSSFLFRAFYAMPQLTNGDGMPTGAIYGVINMLKNTMESLKPDQMVVVFDAKGKNFRHDLYSDYKANRAKMPDELAVQIEPLFAMIQAMGLPLVIESGYEADDVIATLAKHYVGKGSDVLIATGDKDLAQLVNEHIELIDTMKDQRLNEAGVYEKFGVYPHQIIDYLSLIGDVSDHVPGIPKVGPKTAVKWLQMYGTIDGLLAHKEEIKGKVGESLREHYQQLDLSKQLITIKQDVPLSQNPDAFTQQSADQQQLKSWYQKLNFKRWSNEISDELEHLTVRWLTAPDDWASFALSLSQMKNAIIQLELIQLEKPLQQCVGLTIKIHDDQVYIPLAPHQDALMTFEDIKPWLEAWLSHTENTWYGYGLKAMIRFCLQEHMNVMCHLFDVGCAAYVLDSSRAITHLGNITEPLLNQPFVPVTSALNRQGVMASVASLADDDRIPYVARQITLINMLKDHLVDQLNAQQLMAICVDVEMPLIRVLARMEWHGVAVSGDHLATLQKHFELEMSQLESEAYQVAGTVFNLQSTKQLRELLYDVLGLPVLEKTPKGVPSTSEAVLAQLGKNYELPRIISRYRSLAKLKSTYTEGLSKAISAQTKRIHGFFNQTITLTGRLSSTDPNLQNIPIKTSEGRQIRQAFTADEGKVLIALDYSQIELRIMAHFSQDKALVSAFDQDEDVHAITAAEIHHVSLSEVTPEMRRLAKAVNFGLMYGMSSYGLAKQLDISRSDAKHYMDTYFERFSGVAIFLDKVRQQALNEGSVATVLGRHIPVQSINNPRAKQAAMRAAVNAPMQGSAADIIKSAMVNIDQRIQGENSIKMVLQVHDELIFEVDSDQQAYWTTILQDLMLQALPLSVPLRVSLGYGYHWEEAHA